jgi:hypothetical protein
MNPTLKSIISFLIKYPLYYVVVNGLSLLTGWNVWWCVPLSIIIILSYNIGEMIRGVIEND